MADCGWNCWYASGQFGPAGARRGYVKRPAGARPLAKPALQTTPPLSVTVITYEYDPLYRLTTASYTGGITAAYNYAYDAVGNMTTYTETAGTNTTSVNRTFNAANQLIAATDTQLGTTSYYYDANGNLTRILPPGVNAGEEGEQTYGYNQRNLLTGSTVGTGSGVYDPVAGYLYNGDGRRVQQIDYSGAQPVTTTYRNDNLGLSQVLIADNGVTQTANLYGLDLISQDNGTQTRTLLADGLGSVRQEMAGGAIQTATTYEPYGSVLAQTGNSNTTYAFTGEQFDGSTGLLYLRARYYNPGLRLFMGRDPWRGSLWRPSTLHGLSYVGNNPVNFVDPTGLIPCLPAEDAAGLCLPPQSGRRTNLFNFRVLPGSPGSEITAYLQVGYRLQPWGQYKSAIAPSYPVLVPVRHPLNLLEENPDCIKSLDAAKAFYTSGSFTAWEVNARNIIVEMKGTIQAQKEWSLRDAIAIAYVPYNRVAFNDLPREQRYPKSGATYFPYEGRDNALGMLLQGDGQFAVSSTEGLAYTAGIKPGENYRDVYHFALVVAFGVDRRYFIDTSYGANEYFHSASCDNEHKYAFFKNQQYEFFRRKDRQFTSEELAAQGGWPDWASDPGWYYDNWITGFPPQGCNISRE